MTGRSLEQVRADVVAFARARRWEQFHDPKNLSMALMAEAGELGATLRWTSNSDSDEATASGPIRDAVIDEIGDVGILLLLLCDRLGVRVEDAMSQKLLKNEARYPLERSIGSAERPAITR